MSWNDHPKKYKETMVEIIMYTLLTLAVTLLMEIVINYYP